MKERLGLETRDNLLPADLYSVHLYNVFSCAVLDVYWCYILQVHAFLSKQTEAGSVADVQRKMISNRI